MIIKFVSRYTVFLALGGSLNFDIMSLHPLWILGYIVAMVALIDLHVYSWEGKR